MKRGEIWMVDFGPATGPEQAGVRPAIILQDDSLGQVFATTIVVPLTTNLRRLSLPATLLLKAGEGGLPRDSVALCFQVQVRGKARLTQRLGELPAGRLAEVAAELQTAIGL